MTIKKTIILIMTPFLLGACAYKAPKKFDMTKMGTLILLDKEYSLKRKGRRLQMKHGNHQILIGRDKFLFTYRKEF